MKKRNKGKKLEMPEFSFKEFTPEEGRIYEEAMNQFRMSLGAGKTLKQAYESYAISDISLQKLIQADFLKILIAERHFGKQQPLEEIATALDVTQALLKETLARMLQEVGMTSADQFGQELDDMIPKMND